jgi:membrane fusion protein (multidrug efflux system)
MTENTNTNKNKRNNILVVLTILMLAAGISYVIYYKLYGQFHETTDNAYVGQNVIYITPQISGIVDDVNVHLTQKVKAGEILGHLNSDDYNLSFEESKNRLIQTLRSIKKLYTQNVEAQAAVALAKINVKQTKEDLDRNTMLYKTKSITENAYDNYKYAYEKASQNLLISGQKAKALKDLIGDNKIEDNPQIKQAVMALKQNYLNLQRCTILAPKSGTIAQKNFSIGSHVTTENTLLALVTQRDTWVDANFKEPQLKNIRIGQKVELYSDMYGKEVVYHGVVKGIAAGTGSVFSLLPAQNATGNWIKIVQRVPVRIVLDENEVKAHPLHMGNSMEVDIDTHDRNNKVLKNIVSTEYKSQFYPEALKDANKIADELIKKNL